MNNKKVIILVILSLIYFQFAVAQPTYLCGVDSNDNPKPCTAQDLASKTPNEINQATPEEAAQYLDQLTSDQRAGLNPDQLSYIIQQRTPSALGDLSQYDRTALTSALQNQHYDVSRLDGTVTNAHFEGDTLVIGNSKFDAKTGKPFEVEVGDNGLIKSFNTDYGVSFYNAQGVNYLGNKLTIVSADSVSWYGATSNIVLDFTGESGTFSVKSADRVIVETMTFDN